MIPILKAKNRVCAFLVRVCRPWGQFHTWNLSRVPRIYNNIPPPPNLPPSLPSKKKKRNANFLRSFCREKMLTTDKYGPSYARI